MGEGEVLGNATLLASVYKPPAGFAQLPFYASQRFGSLSTLARTAFTRCMDESNRVVWEVRVFPTRAPNFCKQDDIKAREILPEGPQQDLACSEPINILGHYGELEGLALCHRHGARARAGGRRPGSARGRPGARRLGGLVARWGHCPEAAPLPRLRQGPAYLGP